MSIPQSCRWLIAALSLLAYDPVFAQPILVTTNSDAGPGSLRQALLDANAGGGRNIIMTNLSGTIYLSNALPEIIASFDLLGPGAAQLQIDGNGTDRLFTVASGASNTVFGLTIVRGMVTNGSYGGAIHNAGALTLVGCTISNCAVVGGFGGAIFNAGSLTLRSCTLANNRCIGTPGTNGNPAGGGGGAFGGGVFTVAPLSVTNCVFFGNSCVAGTAGAATTFGGGGLGGIGSGGAIYAATGSVWIVASAFSSNVVEGGVGGRGSGSPGIGGPGLGGSIFADNAVLSLASCSFSCNSAFGGRGGVSGNTGGGSAGRGGEARGGALALQGGQLNVLDTVFRTNKANGGSGGPEAYNPGGDSGNAQGGALFLSTVQAVILRSTIDGNVSEAGVPTPGAVVAGASRGGGIIVDNSTFYITNSTISRNASLGGNGTRSFRATAPTPGGESSGGGAFFTNSSGTFINVTISGNVAAGGRGADASDMTPPSPGANGGTAFGGSLFLKGSNLELQNLTAVSNVALGGIGGMGSYNAPNGTNGLAVGGGVYCASGLVELADTIIGDNSSAGSPDLFGEFASGGHNLIKDTNGSIGWVSTDLLNRSAGLGPLASNGGPTLTHAVLTNSPALDGGSITAILAFDQRGIMRPQRTGADIGAFELRWVLDATVTPGGDVAYEPDQSDYEMGTPVSLRAVAQTGFRFAGWTGDASSNENPLAIVMQTDKRILANFFDTVVRIETAGEGRIEKSPERLSYEIGESVLLTAFPGRWHAFSWGDGSLINPRQIVIGRSNYYAAVFSPTTALERLEFNGVSRLAPVGMPCVFIGHEFQTNSVLEVRGPVDITLKTTFPNGIIFYTLDGSTPSFESQEYTGEFRLTRTATVRAIAYSSDFFQAIEADPIEIRNVANYYLNAFSEGGGTVVREPDENPLSGGTAVTVMAVPDAGWTFFGWRGDSSATNPMLKITMDRSICLEAVFGTELSTTVAGNGSVTLSPGGGVYPYNTTVYLHGVPSSGAYFVRWGNAVNSTNNPLKFTITTSNVAISSLFGALAANQGSLTVIKDGLGQVEVSSKANRFSYGQQVTLTAVPERDQSFLRWVGDVSGSVNPLTVTIQQSTMVTAVFSRIPKLENVFCPPRLPSDGFRIRARGNHGDNYTVLRSTDLSDWSHDSIISNVWGRAEFAVPVETSSQFYRVRLAE